METVTLHKCVLTQLLLESFVISPYCGKGKGRELLFMESMVSSEFLQNDEWNHRITATEVIRDFQDHQFQTLAQKRSV